MFERECYQTSPHVLDHPRDAQHLAALKLQSNMLYELSTTLHALSIAAVALGVLVCLVTPDLWSLGVAVAAVPAVVARHFSNRHMKVSNYLTEFNHGLKLLKITEAECTYHHQPQKRVK
jgi:hypothetical protein